MGVLNTQCLVHIEGNNIYKVFESSLRHKANISSRLSFILYLTLHKHVKRLKNKPTASSVASGMDPTEAMTELETHR